MADNRSPRRSLTHSRVKLIPDSERTLQGLRYILSLPDREDPDSETEADPEDQ